MDSRNTLTIKEGADELYFAYDKGVLFSMISENKEVDGKATSEGKGMYLTLEMLTEILHFLGHIHTRMFEHLRKNQEVGK